MSQGALDSVLPRPPRLVLPRKYCMCTTYGAHERCSLGNKRTMLPKEYLIDAPNEHLRSLTIMAQVSISKAIITIFVAFVLSIAATVSAQDGAMAPAPMDTGAAFFLPVSGVAVAFSLIISLFAMLKL
ncbi:hypothetical protein QQP08_017782 [Theobroma cacao]|nr:hypothetical protein QQP08_017782 [Theobroma cacao]